MDELSDNLPTGCTALQSDAIDTLSSAQPIDGIQCTLFACVFIQNCRYILFNPFGTSAETIIVPVHLSQLLDPSLISGTLGSMTWRLLSPASVLESLRWL